MASGSALPSRRVYTDTCVTSNPRLLRLSAIASAPALCDTPRMIMLIFFPWVPEDPVLDIFVFEKLE